jgi:hypothetical protein
MSIAVGDKLKGTMQITLPDGTHFTAECQMNVIATGESETAAEAKAAKEEAARAEAAAKAAAAHPAAAAAHPAQATTAR